MTTRQKSKLLLDIKEWGLQFNGFNKPHINFQSMYKLFPEFTFCGTPINGEYRNFGQAYGHKQYQMIILYEGTEIAVLNYKEYTDEPEVICYIDEL